jgi:serine O-acetyltransferase
MPQDNEALIKSVRDALKNVIDPELGSNLVDLGMIKDIHVKDGVADIDMVLTSIFCPLAHYLVASVKLAAESVEGISTANVRIVGYGLSP